MKYEIYTDGGYSMMHDTGAFAYVILGDGEEIKRYSEKIEHETNNRAEIKGIMEGVFSLPPQSEIKIYSDSQYAIGVLSGKYKVKANTDLVSQFKTTVMQRGYILSFEWVRGHDGNVYNEICDTLCNEAAGIDLNAGVKKRAINVQTYTTEELEVLWERIAVELETRRNVENQKNSLSL